MNAAPRVLMIVERLYELGGAQQQALRLSRALRSLGVDVRVVTGQWRFSHPRRHEVQGIPVRAVFTVYKMLHLRGLRKFSNLVYLSTLFSHLLLRSRRYDILHVHSATLSAFAVAVAGRALSKPTVMKVMASGGWSDLKRMRERRQFPGGAWMLRSLRRIDRIVCLNDETEEECRREGFRTEQLVRIPNGFPVREVEPASSYEGGQTIEVCFAGRLDGQKDPLCLLEAAAALKERPGGDRIRVRLLGDGPDRERLEARSRELGVARSVRFCGRVEDVPRHLGESHIFVMPSLSEGLSNALLEAMAHGIPCIATAIPGNVDLVRDGETGVLVPPGDPSVLARAMLELAGSPELRERLGRAGRALVEERYDMEPIARRYLELYRELLSGSRIE